MNRPTNPNPVPSPPTVGLSGRPWRGPSRWVSEREAIAGSAGVRRRRSREREV